MAYLITPVCSALEDYFKKLLLKRYSLSTAQKWAHRISISLSIIILILLVFAVIMLIIPQLITSIINFIDHYPAYLEVSEKRLSEFLNSFPIGLRNAISSRWKELMSYVDQYTSDTLLPNLNSMVNGLSSRVLSFARSVVNFLIGFIVALYCLERRKIFALQAKKILFAFFPEEVAKDILARVESANKVFLGFLIGKIIDSIIIGIICFIGVLILKTPYPVLISVIIGVTNIIPFFGPFLGGVPCVILVLLEDPVKALYLAIFIFILQQFDGNILGPKILGESTGITSFWVLFSILLFGGLWGIVGMVIAVPLFVVLYNIAKEITNYRLEKKGLPTAAYCYDNPDDLPKEKYTNDEKKKKYKDAVPQIFMKQDEENKEDNK